jgi:hypothetical protein
MSATELVVRGSSADGHLIVTMITADLMWIYMQSSMSGCQVEMVGREDGLDIQEKDNSRKKGRPFGRPMWRNIVRIFMRIFFCADIYWADIYCTMSEMVAV